jgi:hypothetical protein
MRRTDAQRSVQLVPYPRNHRNDPLAAWQEAGLETRWATGEMEMQKKKR